MISDFWDGLDALTKRVIVAAIVGLVALAAFGPWGAIGVFFAVLLLLPMGRGAATAAPAVAKPAPVAAPVAAKPVAKPAAATAKPAPKPAAKTAAAPAGPKLKAPPASAASGDAPMLLSEPVGGVADDLKLLKGVGPKLESVLNGMGFYHFDQIAGWTPKQVTWVDETMEGVNRGRASRDGWVAQAKVLATGALTEFAKRVEAGDVPTSQG